MRKILNFSTNIARKKWGFKFIREGKERLFYIEENFLVQDFRKIINALGIGDKDYELEFEDSGDDGYIFKNVDEAYKFGYGKYRFYGTYKDYYSNYQ